MDRSTFTTQDISWHKSLETYFLDLIEVVDSFDQLRKITAIVGMLYSPIDPEYSPLMSQIKATYMHLRAGRRIGA